MGGEVRERNVRVERREQRPLAPMVFERRDSVFAAMYLICGFAFVDWIVPFRLGAGVTGFTALLVLVTGLYLAVSSVSFHRKSIAYAAAILAAAAYFCWSDAIFLKVLMFLYLAGLTVYWIAACTGRRLSDGITCLSFWDLVNQLTRVPLINFFCGVHSLGRVKAEGDSKGALGKLLLGLLICVPVLGVVLSLLISADLAFAHLMDLLESAFSERFWIYFVKVLLAIPVSCYLFGMVYGNVKGRGTDRITAEGISHNRRQLQIAPGLTVYTVLTMLNLVYAAFFLSQAGYLFSAFRNALPGTMTYAVYARQGFFELCLIAAINLTVLAAAQLFLRRGGLDGEFGETGKNQAVRNRWMRAETVMLSGFTILLIVTALSKMGLYIHYFGLTRLRVYTSWFMVLILLLFGVIIARQFLEFNGTKGMFLLFTVCFFLLCFGNADGLIVRYNIQRYEAGTLDSFNPYDYSGMSAGAVPYLTGFYEKLPADGGSEEQQMMRIKLYQVITGDYGGDGEPAAWYDGDLRTFNIQAAKAQETAKRLRANPPKNLESERMMTDDNGEPVTMRELLGSWVGLEIPVGAEIDFRNSQEEFQGNRNRLAKVMMEPKEAGDVLKQIQGAEGWQPFPLSEEVQAYLYGELFRGLEYESTRAVELGLPAVSRGYWFVQDREGGPGPAGDGLILYGSEGLTLGIFDADTGILYLVEMES